MGFGRDASPTDPIIKQLEARGQITRFANRDNIPRYQQQGYQTVYDENGMFLDYGG
jgi:hypothetical protein